MDSHTHTLSDLFKQLGLPDDEASITAFIARHAGACMDGTLPQAPLWNESQRAFLEQAVADDADWAQPAEALAGRLRR